VADQVLTLRELNRTLLARQLLLARVSLSPVAAIERLIGLQGQVANAPYIGLWTRLRGFQHDDLSRAIEQRKVVKATVMRATLHLFSATDYLRFRRVLQPPLSRSLTSVSTNRMAGIDIEQVAAEARVHMEEQPRTFAELRDLLVASHPGADERMLGYSVRMHLPTLHAYPGGVWDNNKEAAQVVAEDWLGQPLDAGEDALPELIRRYLVAFGPATVADFQKWSGLQGMRSTFEQLRPVLRTFRTEQGKELFDLPDGLLAAADRPVPVIFTADYDNIVLAHEDRSRIVAREYHARVFNPATRVWATFLVDGFVAGIWKVERKKKLATLTLTPFAPLSPAVQAALSEEGERLVRFAAPDSAQFVVQIAVIS